MIKEALALAKWYCAVLTYSTVQGHAFLVDQSSFIGGHSYSGTWD